MNQKSAVQVGGEKEKYKEYRRGNWSLCETMILIEAKKMDNERKKKKITMVENISGTSLYPIRSQEMRWQWIEEFCWKKGCHRSQNQCNDRWDNLMRDFKKVRRYQMDLREDHDSSISYWKLASHEKKERGLPSNLLIEVYEALVDVVERKESVEERCNVSMVNEVLKDKTIREEAEASDQPRTTKKATDSDGEYDLNSSGQRKRRRTRGNDRDAGTTSEADPHSLASSFSQCASILVQALGKCEEGEERRHIDRLRIQERKFEVDRSQSEIGAQFLGDLATVINRLASSIQSSSSTSN